MGPQTRARFARECWSTPRALVPGPEFAGIAGRPRRPSAKGWNRPGQLVDPAGPWSWPGVTKDCLSTPRALGHGPESHGRAGRHCGPSDPGPSHPGQLVETACPQARARLAREGWRTPLGPSFLGPSYPGQRVDAAGLRSQAGVAQDSCSIPHTLRLGPESPVKSGQLRWHADPGMIRPGELVDAAGPRTRARGLWTEE